MCGQNVLLCCYSSTKMFLQEDDLQNLFVFMQRIYLHSWRDCREADIFRKQKKQFCDSLHMYEGRKNTRRINDAFFQEQET